MIECLVGALAVPVVDKCLVVGEHPRLAFVRFMKGFDLTARA